MKLTFQIGRIIVQKDQYAHMKEGTEEEPNFFGEKEPDFLESREKEALVVYFKRFRVEGAVSKEGVAGKSPFVVLISLRGNFVTFSLAGKGPLGPEDVFRGLEKEASAWSYKFQGVGGGLDSTFRRIHRETENNAIVCTTPDPIWLAGLMHQLRDHGPFTVSLPGARLR